MPEAHATVRFDAASAEDADQIVASWTLPGATTVDVTFVTEQTHTIQVSEPTDGSPIPVSEQGRPLLGVEKPA